MANQISLFAQPRSGIFIFFVSLLTILVSFLVLDKNAQAVSFNSQSKLITQSISDGGLADLVDAVKPAVVNISARFEAKTASWSDVYEPQGAPEFPGHDLYSSNPDLQRFMEQFFKGQRERIQPKQGRSLGSGFIVDPSGLVVTNYHVIKDANEIDIVLDNGLSYPAEIRGIDQKTDLALLEIDTKDKLPFLDFGDSDKSRVGDLVVAIGNPFGLGGTTTAGIISARSRDLTNEPYVDYIQIDASINRGNSGGPLFNRFGEVIGVNTAIFSPNGGSVGIGFAIPASLAQSVVMQLKNKGEVARSWLGIEIQEVSKRIADSLRFSNSGGALISRISPNSPADSSELRVGDIVFEVNGKEVKSVRHLPRLVADSPASESTIFKVWRENEVLNITANLKKLPGLKMNNVAKTKTDSSKPIGLRLAPLTKDKQKLLGDDQVGVIILDVIPNSEADKEGLKSGDIILQIGLSRVSSPNDIINLIKEKRLENQLNDLVFLVDRGGQRRFFAVKIG